MIEIIKANQQHIPIIRQLAQQLWPVAFAAILSTDQIAYMMEMMYSQASLAQQINDGHQYIIASENNTPVAYASYEANHSDTDKTKIHKLYIMPQHQRHGIGKAMIDYVAQQALQAHNNALFLNVNKHNNQAINFYRKHHFVLSKKEEIDIGNGFIMDDFVFELSLNQPQH